MKNLSRVQWIGVIVAVVVVVLLVGAKSMANVGMFTEMNNNTNMTTDTMTAGSMNMPAGLKIEEIVIGDGAQAAPGKLVTAHYKGMLQDGTVFDTSVGRAPFSFPLGAGMVIQGWEKGIVGMKVGGKRVLTISPELGYGAADMKDAVGKVIIPANSTLIFEVELLDVK